jgi:hypothetical protein
MRELDFNAYCVDPGHTSGVAMITHKGDFEAKQVGFEQLYDDLRETVQACLMFQKQLVIACEREIIRPDYVMQDHGVDNWPMEAIGLLKILSIKGKYPLVQYASAQTKKFAPDSTLKVLGWHTPGKPHANDAARVLCALLVQRQASWWKERVKETGLLDGVG